MRSLLIIIMTLIMEHAFAVNKCLIDGKVSYQNPPCPEYSKQQKFEGTVSSISSDRVRGQIEEKQYNEEIARIELEKQREQAIKLQQIENTRSLEEKVQKLEKRVSHAESDASFANIQMDRIKRYDQFERMTGRPFPGR